MSWTSVGTQRRWVQGTLPLPSQRAWSERKVATKHRTTEYAESRVLSLGVLPNANRILVEFAAVKVTRHTETLTDHSTEMECLAAQSAKHRL